MGGLTEVPLVHSTCLRNGSVDFAQFHASNAKFRIKGPALLLVRVGEPKKEKLVHYKGRDTFALSDCVIALTGRRRDLKILHKQLLGSWPSLSKLYRGTGAKYITVAEISGLLRSRGFVVGAPRGNAGPQLARAISNQAQDPSVELRQQWQLFLRKCDDKQN